ncbi:hypothetical protein NKH18_29865 [Streptomyces sp. M10(2022)]
MLTGQAADWATRSSAWFPNGIGLLFLSPNVDCECIHDHVYRIDSIDEPVPVILLAEDREVETPAVLGPADSWTTVVTRRTTEDADLVTLQDMRQDGSDPGTSGATCCARTPGSTRTTILPMIRCSARGTASTLDRAADVHARRTADRLDPIRDHQRRAGPADLAGRHRWDAREGDGAGGRGPRDRDTDPSFSPDGTRMAFTRSTPAADDDTVWTSRVLVADVATEKITGEVVPPEGQLVGGDAQPTWSSDGTALAFTRNQAIRGLGGIKHVWTAPVDALDQQRDLSVTGCPGECKVIDDSPPSPRRHGDRLQPQGPRRPDQPAGERHRHLAGRRGLPGRAAVRPARRSRRLRCTDPGRLGDRALPAA